MKTRFWVTCGLLALTACQETAPTVPATVLQFTEQEAGVEPYRTRMLITPGHLRIDDGTDEGGDYTLYSRKDRIIYSVTPGDKMVLKIQPARMAVSPPRALKHTTVELKGEAPAVGGVPVRHWRLQTNGETCYVLYAAEGLLPEAVAALREFIETLSWDQARSLTYTPQELQTPCHLANNVFAATRYLDHGLPVRRSDMTGRVSELVDFAEGYAAATTLFSTPAAYRQADIKELREQKKN